jgi:tetratricopeptide (TPR) repeat protein
MNQTSNVKQAKQAATPAPSACVHTNVPLSGLRPSPKVHLNRRVMEGTMRPMVRATKTQYDAALDRARDVISEAMAAGSRKKRVALARKALTISPDFADAYVMLAKETRDTSEVRRLLEQGVAAGRRALGKQRFNPNAGRFYGLLEIRPYLRAKHGLAQILWQQGEREAAVTHYQDMLRLDPNYWIVRHILVTGLLHLGRDKEAEDVTSRYAEENSAWMAYSRALLAFRRHGDTKKSRRLVSEAMKHNPHVPAYLLGRKKVPKVLPHPGSDDDKNVAILYASDNVENWRATPGALEWLAARCTALGSAPSVPRRGPG